MDQLLIALDVDTEERALELGDQLRSVAGGFKIGSRLFTAAGPRIVQKLAARGDRVFLDLKYHDIPSTVAGAVRLASEIGAWMLTVHASGGKDMLTAAKEASVKASISPLIVAVTVLTSFDEAALQRTGITRGIGDQVNSLATLSQEAGVDGVVASPLEIAQIRALCGSTFTIVTPGIRNRRSPASMDDQSRTLSAAEAVQAGANYLVVGRPITSAADPLAAATEICEQISKQ